MDREHRYPARSVCWLCGQETDVDPTRALSQCAACGVEWVDPLLPGKKLTEHEREVQRAQERLPGKLRKRYGIPEGETAADPCGTGRQN